MEGANGVGASECERKPLSEVVGDCVQRWFQDAFKEARKGDVANQVLVAQMFFSGYGVPKNEYKGRQWMDRASKYRSSALKVGMKRPGYNASDSDSDEANDDANQ
ncbi:hypothetical protein SEVIR_3G290100v4 [Setaria viridis]|uniref:Uncharacterized protein n=1 Tax=Setaria viridis TaxID=4556 RepID=A0A4U6VEI1_SETVI|nr:uncharacterized protein LOC117850691 [Setaria viridis]XP_034588441.1 uncharacterized protein LOC117850691 [Setaria viridis]TKW27931.1 hypothetical protein SEVIR_3G290100v2 [Setaria viridis]